MENEKLIVVPNGLNNDFYADLINQAESEVEYLDEVENALQEESMMESMIEDMQEQAMMESMMEDMQEQAMMESMMEDMQEQAMIESMMEDMQEQAMIESMMQAAMEDAMMDQQLSGYYGGSSPDKKTDVWVAVYDDFSTKSSEDINTLSKKELLCFIHKKFDRTSKSGKTAYFSYKVVNEELENTQLQIGNFICKLAESEHWVSWNYDDENIEEQHYLTYSHRNNSDYKFGRTFIYPIDYTFASIVPLHKYNPFRFSFKKLNFISKNDASSCGDKLSRLKLFDIKERFLELSIYDFENNIIPLLKEINSSVSFMDFVLKQHLSHSVKYLYEIKKDIQRLDNEFIIISFNNIKENIDKMLEKNSTFLPHSIKNNPNSEVNLLIKEYNTLVSEITKLV